jgi:drug/metabolite transporter (DMT)-like permease
MVLFWRGRGWWVTWIALLAMVAPMIVAGEIDGPAVDRGVALAMGLAAAATFGLGVLFGRDRTAEDTFLGLPLQVWAVPMLVFALLLGIGTITTAEEPPAGRSAGPPPGGGPKSPGGQALPER